MTHPPGQPGGGGGGSGTGTGPGRDDVFWADVWTSQCDRAIADELLHGAALDSLDRNGRLKT